MAKILNLISDYPRQGFAPYLTAIISFLQEKRKKKGIFSREEEVIDSIRVGCIPLKSVQVSIDGSKVSVIEDPSCSLEPIFELEDYEAWKSVLSGLGSFMDIERFSSKVLALSSFKPPKREVRLRGIAPSFLFSLLSNVVEVDLCPDSGVSRECDPLSTSQFKSLLNELPVLRRSYEEMGSLASEVRFICDEKVKELDSYIERYPPDSPMRKRYQRERGRIEGSCSTLISRINSAVKWYMELINTISSAPSIDDVLMPVFLVETRGKERRRFIITNLRFKSPGLAYKMKNIFGKFDSLFDETGVSRRFSSILHTEAVKWSSNLLDDDVRELVYGELALLQEEGFINEEYSDSIADLISKSLLR